MSLDTSFPQVELPFLPPNTIVPWPEDRETFVQYMNRLYEDIAFTVNQKDSTYFTIAMSDVAQDIPNVNNFGAYVICVSGADTDVPTFVGALTKSDRTAAGIVSALSLQAGTNAWAGNLIVVTSTATNFQIRHDRAGVTANFNLRIIGTQ